MGDMKMSPSEFYSLTPHEFHLKSRSWLDNMRRVDYTHCLVAANQIGIHTKKGTKLEKILVNMYRCLHPRDKKRLGQYAVLSNGEATKLKDEIIHDPKNEQMIAALYGDQTKQFKG